MSLHVGLELGKKSRLYPTKSDSDQKDDLDLHTLYSFKTDTDFKDCPFLLSHNLDFEECVPSRDCLNVFSEEGGLSVSRWKGREWSFMGVENAVPIILCHLDLQEAVSITVIADFTTSTNHRSGY